LPFETNNQSREFHTTATQKKSPTVNCGINSD